MEVKMNLYTMPFIFLVLSIGLIGFNLLTTSLIVSSIAIIVFYTYKAVILSIIYDKRHLISYVIIKNGTFILIMTFMPIILSLLPQFLISISSISRMNGALPYMATFVIGYIITKSLIKISCCLTQKKSSLIPKIITTNLITLLVLITLIII